MTTLHPRTCPTCGSTDMVPLVYGMVGVDTADAEQRGELVIAGCLVYDGAPEWHCRACGNEWHPAAWSFEPLERWSEPELRTLGFEGFVPFSALPSADVPRLPGVYVAVRPERMSPQFLERSPAGWFKRRDPTIPLADLYERWLPNASVVYIGKAHWGARRTRGLHRRLDEFRRHGAGQAVGHWGGRAIWQFVDSDQLLVAWHVTDDEDAGIVESRLLERFSDRHGALPFANRRN